MKQSIQISSDMTSGLLPSALYEQFQTESQMFNFDSRMPPRMLIPRRLGRACMLKSYGNDAKAEEHVKIAHKELNKYTQEEQKAPRRLMTELQTHQYGNFVLNASNPSLLETKREFQYAKQIAQLEYGQKRAHETKDTKQRAEWKGFTNEMTTLALLNRGRRPTMAALPALSHHENGPEAIHNYDVLLLGKNLFHDEVTGQKIQVKSSRHYAETNNGYSSDIFLLCAEDLLGYEIDAETGRCRYPVADALIAEHRGDADEAMRSMLDRTTEHVLYVMGEHYVEQRLSPAIRDRTALDTIA